MPLFFAVLSCTIVVPSVPLYVIMLYSLLKYRRKFPFNSTFFKVSLHLGFFDLLHLFNDWVMGMLHYFGLYDYILENQNVFAYQFDLVWWYSAVGQKLGILALAIDRVACLYFAKVLQSKCKGSSITHIELKCV